MRAGRVAAVAVVLFASCSVGLAGNVPLVVREPSGLSRSAWPITSGIPFERGALHESDRLRLTDPGNGSELPLQTRVTCRWPDGSIKWLLMDTAVDLAPGQLRPLALRFGDEVEPAASDSPASRLFRTQSDDKQVAIATGPLRAVILRGRNLPGPVCIDRDADGQWTADKQITSEPWVLSLVTAEGTVYRSDVVPADIRVEETGPLRAVVRVEGPLATADRTPYCRFLARLQFYAGQPFVKAFITLIVDVPDREMVDVESFSLMLPGDDGENWRCVFGGEGAEVREPASPADRHRLFQVDDQQCQLDAAASAERAAGWAGWMNGRAAIHAGVRHFWEQWPKAISADARGLSIELMPAFEEGLYDGRPPADEAEWTYALREGRTRLKAGVAKTHEVWVRYGDEGKLPEDADNFFRRAFEPPLATCEPAYICRTKVLGDFPPAGPTNPGRFMGYDGFIAQAFEDHLNAREKTREYGLLNFGDWWGERGHNWGNLEYDMQRGLLAQYARTGRRDYYLRAEEAARHHIDVDVVHAVNPHLKHKSGPPPAVGHVWVHATGHTGGYFPEGAFGLEWPYTIGYSRNLGHIWARGDLDYYFLSGDERARDVGLLIAETLRRDAAPHFRIGTHMRDIGWPMMAMMAAYRATGDTRYLDAVRHGWEVLHTNEDPGGGWSVKLAKDHCLHNPPQCRGNVGFILGIVISALCDYHRETNDPQAARSIVGAVDFIIRDTYLPDKRAFRYTSCPLSPVVPTHVTLLSESLAYAWQLTGDEKYRRVLRDATEVFHESLKRSGMGKGFSQHLIFSPEGLWGLDQTAQEPPTREAR